MEKCNIKFFYRFVLLVATADQGPKEDVGVEAGVGAEVLLISPVLLVHLERLLPLGCIICTNVFPMPELVQV